ncbi:MAG: hypothetical protein PHI29_13355 [Gallionella sp.]|nr:hypothetical protein [Gallionella sp.]
MVDRDYQINKQADVKVYIWMEVDVEMSQNDTVTLAEFSDAENLKVATLVRKTDMTVLTNSISNNQVTCTNAGTNMQCVLFIGGVKAT